MGCMPLVTCRARAQKSGYTSYNSVYVSTLCPIAFPYLYRSCTRDICKIWTFSNFQMFGWIKSKLFTCLIRGFSFYYIKQMDKILPLSDPLASAARGHFFVLPTI